MSFSSFLTGLVGDSKKAEASVVSFAAKVEATQLYGIVKGIAQIALIADPALAVAVNAGINTLDALVGDVKAATKTSAASAVQLQAAASALLVSTAGVIKVVASK